MKRLLIIMSTCLLFIALFGELTFANTGMHFMRIGRLWVNAEYDGAEGWGGEYAWPGGYLTGAYSGIRELWGGNVRKTGTLAGCVNWKGPNGKTYPYWTSGCYRSYDYNYPVFFVDQTNQTAVHCVTQILYQRWPQPNVFVDGKSITPDGGDDFITQHKGDAFRDVNTQVDPKLITERAIKSVWRYTMGVEYNRMMYGYCTPKHQDYVIYDITLTNNGKVFGLPGETPAIWPNPNWPYVLQNQKIEGFWWGFMVNTWNSRAGRDYSFGANDEEGEFITPFASSGNDRRFFLFYDGDKTGDAVKDWGDPSKNERWIELLSPAWIAMGALYADKSSKDKVNDNAQPNATKMYHQANWDLGRTTIKTMEAQYTGIFKAGDHWPVGKLSRDGDPTIVELTGQTSFGPYNLDFGESINISYVIAAGGLSKDLCIKYGKKAWDAKYTGAVMDEIETLYKTSRDSVLNTLRMADWNVNGSKPGGRKKYDVPDPPRPPANLGVAAEGPKIKISWSDEPRNDPDFDTGVKDFKGYRVYRATGARDSVYHKIYDGTANEYLDAAVSPGHQYFYYVVAYDDGTQNWQDAGVSLEGGRFYAWTGWAPTGVQPKVQAISDKSKLESVRVVPNPYSAAGKKYPGEMDKIVFMGLPGKCTIRIYTSSGNFVHKIEHTDGAGKEDWDLKTEFNQYIVSDVYIYTVESDLGKYVDKFIVIR